MLLLTFSPPSVAAKVRPSYVSARAYWHLLKANLAWHRGDLSTARESFRVALIYDPGSRLVRARLTEFLWSHEPQYSTKKLRKQQRRLRGDPRIYRLLALEKWSRGQLDSAATFFRRAFLRMDKSYPQFRYILIRDYALFLKATGRTTSGFRVTRKISDLQLRNALRSMVFGDCESRRNPYDGEHICDEAVASGVKAVKQDDAKGLHHWLKPIQNPTEFTEATRRCSQSTKNSKECRVLRNQLKRLVHPLPILSKSHVQ